jgi:hypothetical protein
MSQPPLDPPPFDEPMILRCIKTNVRIQNHEHTQEVLILTSVLCSVESQLNPNPNRSLNSNQENDSEEENWDDTASSDEDISDFFETSSDDEESDNDTDRGNNDINRNAQNRGPPLRAFWLRGDPICEVRPFPCLPEYSRLV